MNLFFSAIFRQHNKFFDRSRFFFLVSNRFFCNESGPTIRNIWLSTQHYIVLIMDQCQMLGNRACRSGSVRLRTACRCSKIWRRAASRCSGTPSGKSQTSSHPTRSSTTEDRSREGKDWIEPELIGSLKLGNVWVSVQLIFGPRWPMHRLNKNPNIAKLETSHQL